MEKAEKSVSGPGDKSFQYDRVYLTDPADLSHRDTADPNAQDEATITVIATGLDEEAPASLGSAMGGFGRMGGQQPVRKPAAQAAAPAAQQSAYQQASAQQAAPQPAFQQAAPAPQPVQQAVPQQAAPAPQPVQQPAPEEEPVQPTWQPKENRKVQINIPDFLKNRK